jgi:hypothetical protein
MWFHSIILFSQIITSVDMSVLFPVSLYAPVLHRWQHIIRLKVKLTFWQYLADTSWSKTPRAMTGSEENKTL